MAYCQGQISLRFLVKGQHLPARPTRPGENIKCHALRTTHYVLNQQSP
jgi:hypothetical protein